MLNSSQRFTYLSVVKHLENRDRDYFARQSYNYYNFTCKEDLFTYKALTIYYSKEFINFMIDWYIFS